MTTEKFRDYKAHQVVIPPPALDEWLPEDHPVYFVYQFDLSALYRDNTGCRRQPSDEPRMMVSAWLYTV